MDTRYPKPAWWQLYGAMAVIGAMLFVEAGTNLSSWEHKVVEIMIVVVAFAVLCLWLLVNAVALEYEDIEAEHAPDEPAPWQAHGEDAHGSDLSRPGAGSMPAGSVRNTGRSIAPPTRSSLN